METITLQKERLLKNTQSKHQAYQGNYYYDIYDRLLNETYRHTHANLADTKCPQMKRTEYIYKAHTEHAYRQYV